MSLEDGGKPAWLSKGVIGGVVVMALGVAKLLGVDWAGDVSGEEVTEHASGVVDGLWGAAVAVFGFVAAWGRWVASQKIG